MTIRTASRIFGRLFALAAVLLGLGNLTGCGGFFQAITTTTTTNSGTGYDIVYAGKNDSNSFVGYAVLSTGLTAVTGSPFSLNAPPLSMAITPTNTYLYVGTASGIYGYSIAAGGGLTILNSGSYVANNPNALAPVSAMDISPDGKWLVVLNDNGGSIYVLTYQIATSTGLLSPSYNDNIQLSTTANIYSATNAANSIAQAIKFSPDENSQTVSVIAASLGTGGEMTLTFNSSTGAVAYADLEQPLSTGIQDNGVAWATNSSTLYFTRGGSASAIISYGVDPTSGLFTASAVSGPTPGTNPSALSFNSNQAYLYVTNAPSSTTGSINGYSLSTTGSTTTFTALSQSPYSTSSIAPYAIAFDNSDTYMLVMNQAGPLNPPDLIQYTIDGVLDSTSTTPGRLYINSSVNTGLTATGVIGSGPGITMATTH